MRTALKEAQIFLLSPNLLQPKLLRLCMPVIPPSHNFLMWTVERYNLAHIFLKNKLRKPLELG